MLDIKKIRENPEYYIAETEKKYTTVSLKDVLAIDNERRPLLTEVERLKSERNAESKRIGDLKKKGENADEADFRSAPILSFSDTAGVYCDELAATGRVVVFSIYDAKKADWSRMEQQYRTAQASQARPLLLVSATKEELPVLPPDVEPYFSDYKTLITLNRSNGGGTYFHEGELVNKWDAAHFPENLGEDFSADPVDLSTRYIVKRRLYMQGFCVYLAALLLLV